VTIPSLHDGDEWTRFEAARRALSKRFGNAHPRPDTDGAPASADRAGRAGGDTHGKLEGKIALVTGGNSGIGPCRRRSSSSGSAYVFITGRRQRSWCRRYRRSKEIDGVQGDVSNLGDLDRLFARINGKGTLDIVFANAGVAKYGPPRRSRELYDRIFDINVKGLLFTVAEGALR